MVGKKGDGLSMNVIIIAILALLVLVVLTLIFIRQMDKNETVQNSLCTLEAVGARCVSLPSDLPNGGQGYTQVSGKSFTDCPAPKACYKPSS